MNKPITAAQIIPHAYALPSLAAEHEAAIGRAMLETERKYHTPGLPPTEKQTHVPQCDSKRALMRERRRRILTDMLDGEWRRRSGAFADRVGTTRNGLVNLTNYLERDGLLEFEWRPAGSNRDLVVWMRITEAGREVA